MTPAVRSSGKTKPDPLLAGTANCRYETSLISNLPPLGSPRKRSNWGDLFATIPDHTNPPSSITGHQGHRGYFCGRTGVAALGAFWLERHSTALSPLHHWPVVDHDQHGNHDWFAWFLVFLFVPSRHRRLSAVSGGWLYSLEPDCQPDQRRLPQLHQRKLYYQTSARSAFSSRVPYGLEEHHHLLPQHPGPDPGHDLVWILARMGSCACSARSVIDYLERTLVGASVGHIVCPFSRYSLACRERRANRLLFNANPLEA